MANDFLVGYRRFGGSKATASDIDTVINSMSLNGLINHSRLLTGTQCMSFCWRMRNSNRLD